MYPTTVEVLGFQASSRDVGAGAATPVPATEMDVGEFEALLTTAILPATLIAVAGSKLTFSAAAWAGAKISPEETPFAARPAPATITFEIVTFEPPEFVTLIVRVTLVPTFSLPKLIPVGFTEIWPGAIAVVVTAGAVTGVAVTGLLTGGTDGAGAAFDVEGDSAEVAGETPVPLKPAACAPRFSTRNTIDPVRRPAADGVKLTVPLHVWPGLRMAGSEGPE